MLNNSNLLQDPLKIIGQKAAAGIENGGCAAILARAGVGKTALMVQLAIYAMLNNKNIMHISTDNPVDKIDLWYREVFKKLVHKDNSDKDKLWEQLLHRRFIMTFETETFNLDKMEKRISELMASRIFQPAQIMIDGFSTENRTGEQLEKIREFALANGLIMWFTMRTHRDEPVEASGIPSSFSPFAGFFDLMLLLHPNKNRVYLKMVPKSDQQDQEEKSELYLDPATMLISDTPA